MQRMLLAVALFATVHCQADEVSARIVEHGIYFTRTDSTVDAPATTTGELTLLQEPMHVRTTETIPALRGSSFGIRYVLEGVPPDQVVDVTDVILTPGLKNPNSSEATVFKETHQDRVRGGKQVFTGYTFNHVWEAVPGEWTIEVWAGSRRLLVKSFDVVPSKPFRN